MVWCGISHRGKLKLLIFEDDSEGTASVNGKVSFRLLSLTLIIRRF